MEQPNFEAVIKHIELGTPLLSGSIEEQIAQAFKTYQKEHPNNTEGSFIISNLLGEYAPNQSALKKYWNRMIIANYGNVWLTQNETPVIPVKQTPAPVIPLSSRASINADARRRTSSEIHHLGNAAEDVMGSAYVQDFKKGKL